MDTNATFSTDHRTLAAFLLARGWPLLRMTPGRYGIRRVIMHFPPGAEKAAEEFPTPAGTVHAVTFAEAGLFVKAMLAQAEHGHWIPPAPFEAPGLPEPVQR